MSNPEDCAFCDKPSLAWRTIRAGEFCTSIVSVPWFRSGHCLVIPNRHIIHPSEILPEEGAAIMTEIGKLSLDLDEGYGTGMTQKYQPLLPENDIKKDHAHYHVFPRKPEESDLVFPVPEPNNFKDGFYLPAYDEAAQLTQWLRRSR